MVLDRTKFIREWAKYSKSVVSDSDCKKICNLKGLDDDMFQVVVDVFWVTKFTFIVHTFL